MFSGEIRSLLFQVITSWQVLAVTVVLVVYFFIVSYVARVYYRRPRRVSAPRKSKTKMPEPSAGGPGDDNLDAGDLAATSDSDDLGLEEPGAPGGKN